MAERILKPMDYREFGVTVRGFAPRHRIFNRYILQRLLGSGGMGVVWLAQDEQLGRAVALKFLNDSLFHDPTALDELKRETRKCLELTHHNIVRVYDFIQDKDWAAISMEFVDGDTLRNLQTNKASGVYEPLELEKWIWQLTDALEYAHHTARLVHRDLKPANLILNRRGDLKIADFGIARNVSEGHRVHQDEVSGIGTPVYMSPQQMNGDPPTVADDIYSLGTTLYELVTGRPPFYEGDITHQVMTAIPPMLARRREEFGVRGGVIPKCWEDTIARCLAKRPQDRPLSVREVAELLYPQSRFANAMQALLGADDTAVARPGASTASFKPPTTYRQVAPPPPPEPPAVRKRQPVRWKIPRRTWFAIGIAAIAALTSVAFFAFRPTMSPPMPEPEPAQPEEQIAPKPPATTAAKPPAIPSPAPAPVAPPSAADLESEGALIRYLDKLPSGPDAPRPSKELDAEQLALDRRARDDFKQGKLSEAAGAYRKILQVSPSNAHALANLAAVLVSQNQPKEALEFASRAAALDPANAEVRLFIGVAASSLKWTALAERQFLDAIRLSPDYGAAHLNLAILYATANPPLTDRARKHLERARALGETIDPQLERLLEK